MEEGRYALVILDAPNLRVDDFRDAMSAAQVHVNNTNCIMCHKQVQT
jgi:hypothetical protein